MFFSFFVVHLWCYLLNMITTKKQLKECLQYEKERYVLPRFFCLLGFLGISEKSIIWRYQKKLRKYEYHLNNKHKIRALLFNVSTNRIGRKYGIHIGPNCFDVGLKIMHLGSILINNNSKIGKNCILNINVSFVATGGNSDGPVVGNDCAFGVGSILVGGISLMDEVVVGAGAVVTKSFKESHITLGGVPARIISHKACL